MKTRETAMIRTVATTPRNGCLKLGLYPAWITWMDEALLARRAGKAWVVVQDQTENSLFELDQPPRNWGGWGRPNFCPSCPGGAKTAACRFTFAEHPHFL